MITIEQLLESVDLDFEPRWVTKNKNGVVYICEQQPIQLESIWYPDCKYGIYSHLKLAEFDGKDWAECIYEVPRKTTVKIEEFTREDFETIPDGHRNYKKVLGTSILDKLNTLVDAVNELKGAKNE